MPKGVAKGKKLILVPSDLLARLMEISNRKGKTFYSLVSEIFEHALRVYESEQSLQEVVDFYELMETQRTSGAVIIPVDVLSYLISKLYSSEREEMLKKWYESGQWYGKYLLTKFHNRNQMEAFGELLMASRWDLKEVHVEENSEVVKLRCVSPLLPFENTELLVKFLEGVMQSLGYKTTKEDYLKGIILLEFQKDSPQP